MAKKSVAQAENKRVCTNVLICAEMDYKNAFGNSQRMIYNEYQYLSLKKKKMASQSNHFMPVSSELIQTFYEYR